VKFYSSLVELYARKGEKKMTDMTTNETIEVIDTEEELENEEVLDTTDENEEVEDEETEEEESEKVPYGATEILIGTMVIGGITYLIYRVGSKVVCKVKEKLGKTSQKKEKKHLQMPFEFKWKGLFKKEEPEVAQVEIVDNHDKAENNNA
jgi:hypothetical protein